jgi:hypothetical protein
MASIFEELQGQIVMLTARISEVERKLDNLERRNMKNKEDYEIGSGSQSTTL